MPHSCVHRAVLGSAGVSVTDEQKPQSNKWILFPLIAFTLLAGFALTASYYWIDGGENIAWYVFDPDAILRRIIDRIMELP